MKSIYNLIKDKLRQYPSVKNSILGNSDHWKRGHYVILAEIIKDELAQKVELQNERRFELGTSISHITLQRFFENDYDPKTHNDLRFIKTLDKICIFLGYNDLNDFVTDAKQGVIKDKELDKGLAADIVLKYCERNFMFFKHLPAQRLDLFEDLIFENSPFIERIKDYSAELCERKIKLYTVNNRSNYEVFDLDIISEDDETTVVKTQEFWNLVFEAEKSDKSYIINELNTQIYFVKKIGDEVKIWDNYNPNAGLLNSEIEKSRSNNG